MRSTDDLSAVFTFFLCVSAVAGTTLLAVREVLVGGVFGVLMGTLFGVITASVSQLPVYSVTWHLLWTAPLCMTLTYYLLSVTGLQGPDKLQLISAETSCIILLVVPFPYTPLRGMLGQENKWSLILESLVTRSIALVNGCLVALIYRAIGKGIAYLDNRRKRETRWKISFLRRKNTLSGAALNLLSLIRTCPEWCWKSEKNPSEHTSKLLYSDD